MRFLDFFFCVGLRFILAFAVAAAETTEGDSGGSFFNSSSIFSDALFLDSYKKNNIYSSLASPHFNSNEF